LSNDGLTTTSELSWTGSDRLPRLRSILLGITLFVGLLVWVAFSLGLTPRGTHLVSKLRALGIMTWLYAGVQIADLKLWHSRFARRRRAGSRIPEVLEGWLFAQMFPWFGIAYYILTDDARWYVAGLILFVASFLVFPVPPPTPPTPRNR